MTEAFQPRNLWRLALGLVSIYLLAPTLDRRIGVFVSLVFALNMILSSRPVFDRRHLKLYGAYIVIDILTYHMLLNDQPWDWLLGGGMFESSAAPLVACSVIMSLAGGLLLPDARRRVIYAVFTLGLQIPFGLAVGYTPVQTLLDQLAHGLHYPETYAGIWQGWQLEWMLTYYLPVYFLNYVGRTAKSER